MFFSNAPVASADFVATMAQHISSVCVITTEHEGQRYGLTATAVVSVCAEPPRLLVCVRKTGSSHDMIEASAKFCVNVLCQHQEDIAKGFSGMLGRTFDRFSQGTWHQLATGAPVLESAAAVFDCEVKQAIDQYTHTIFIGEVVGLASDQNKTALLYGTQKFLRLS